VASAWCRRSQPADRLGGLVQAVTALIDEHEPAYVLAPNSAAGLDYAPAVAERQSMPLVTDATRLAVGASGLVVTRAFYGGKAEGTVRVDGGALS
jgi:electron transfer flavoprotein alpha subunit